MSSEYNYQCGICSKGYKTYIWYKNHLDTVHKKSFVDSDSENEIDYEQAYNSQTERRATQSKATVKPSKASTASSLSLSSSASSHALNPHYSSAFADSMQALKSNSPRSSIEARPVDPTDQIIRIARIESNLEAVLSKLHEMRFQEPRRERKKNNVFGVEELSDQSDYDSENDPKVISSKDYKEYSRAYKEIEKKNKKSKKEKKKEFNN